MKVFLLMVISLLTTSCYLMNVGPETYEKDKSENANDPAITGAIESIEFEGTRSLEIEVYPYSNGDESGDVIKIKLKKIK